MPTVIQATNAAESWEALALSPDSSIGTDSFTSFSAHAKLADSEVSIARRRLDQLKYLGWSHIPPKTADLISRQFPRVVVNPSPGLCPVQADSTIAFDDAVMHVVAPFWEPEQSQVSSTRNTAFA